MFYFLIGTILVCSFFLLALIFLSTRGRASPPPVPEMSQRLRDLQMQASSRPRPSKARISSRINMRNRKYVTYEFPPRHGHIWPRRWFIHMLYKSLKYGKK